MNNPGKINPAEIDLSGVSSGGFTPLPDATYRCRLAKWEMKTTQGGENPGTPMVVLQHRVDGDVHPEYKGRIIFDNIPLLGDRTLPDGTEKKGTIFRLKQFLDAVGEDTSGKINVNVLGQHVGTTVYGVKVNTEAPKEGTDYEPRNRVKKYVPDSGDTSSGDVLSAVASSGKRVNKDATPF